MCAILNNNEYNAKVETFGNDYRGLNHFVMDHTIKMCNADEDLIKDIEFSLKNQKVIYEIDDIPFVDNGGPTSKVIVSNKRTLEAAEHYREYKKVAVLNFANNHSPGGSPWSAGAQEESMCRISTLWLCLDALRTEFYDRHANDYKSGKIGILGNDDLIYTPDVIVFKTDESAPKMKDKFDYFKVDVITSAAPELRHGRYDGDELYNVIYKRLKRVFDVAKINNVEVLILGAYGCGAFGNPPDVVARIFNDLVKKYNFKTIEFAVYCRSYEPNNNYEIFKKNIDLASNGCEKFALLTKHISKIEDYYKEINDLMNDIHTFYMTHPEYGHEYDDVLNKYNIELSENGVRQAYNKLDELNADAVIAMLVCAIRMQHFDDVSFYRMMSEPMSILSWLRRLRDLDNKQK